MTISPLRLVLFLLVVGLLTWCAFEYQGNQLVAARADLIDATADLHTEREAARLAGEQLAARDQLDTHHTQELNSARSQINALQLAVADGRYRLRIKAICPAMPGATGATGLADAGSAELAADARPDYFTLRDQLALSRQMILGLQDYIRQVVQRTPVQP
ncbi:Prophage PSPPH06, lysis protein [Pseudomonas cannabina pv. alisalensis]|uniref:Prophage PSPPH06, lysis protein n=2 Tax=Pseudomonas cannabina TaxID=86840 RepID=A0A3M3S9P6_PSECA|nr:lysis system i-spanin subunit Rz [Pseudomonas cannabina]KPW22038.1 Prophage PSPPH06, lysis protein [Pseudomonas cannabina pv. alisalensis]MBM0141736.1 lysis protein [Pseudomonas cannabina pv. alisalensis]RMN78462.1 Prophage PSPPH06, lysis protein [Pseudomonas cannabina]RMO05115.1 Prophage PSPPH06, lysis protein [Pseudomonas cannabina]